MLHTAARHFFSVVAYFFHSASTLLLQHRAVGYLCSVSATEGKVPYGIHKRLLSERTAIRVEVLLKLVRQSPLF